MNPEYQRLTRILAKAAGLSDPQERSVYLDEACGDDAGLRTEVERLLQAYQEAGDFLEHAADPAMDEAKGEGPGTVIGHYKLLEQIGEGAFGRVFMAEQVEPVRRKVALKVVKPGMDSREVVARFEAERQALALMDHPNIAHVYDAGTTGMGRPYFVMELVPGLPITRYCDEHDLSTFERLRLFLQVCHAVQHAHQKAVIHRDLKPTNILVSELDGEVVPKVIDFGVAKALGQQLTEKTLFTGFQQMVGTPAYMSPEQTALSSADVDTRSDVYSLGVLLYELLTGAAPLDAATLHRAGIEEMRRMIREAEPPKPSTRLRTMGDKLPAVARHRHTEPSTLARLVHGDLDWIAMKALEKDRARRYQTISALAEDIERHLASEPVAAGPPGVLYRARKFVRRHMFGAALSAAAVAGVLLSVVALAYGLVQARQERERADTEARNARTEAEVSDAVNAFLLEDLLSQASPEVQPGRQEIFRPMVELAAERAGERFHEQPEIELQVRLTLCGIYRDLGELVSARLQMDRAMEICRQEQLDGEDLSWLGVRHADGRLLLAEGHSAKAQKIYEELVPVLRRLRGPEHRKTLMAMNNLALAYLRQRRPAEGQELCETLLPILRRLQGPRHPDTLRATNLLANAFRDQGNPAQAQKLFEEVLPAWRERVGPDHPGTLMTRNSLANTLMDQEQNAEAQKLYEEIRADMRRVLGPEHPFTLTVRNNLALALLRQGKTAEAQELAGELLPDRQRVLGPDHPDTLRTMHDLAKARGIQGKHAEAQQLFEQVLPDMRRVLGPEHPDTLSTMHNLAHSFLNQHRPAEAQRVFEEILPIMKRVLGPDHPQTLRAMYTLTFAYLFQGKPRELQQLCEELGPFQRRGLGDEHAATLKTRHNLAVAHLLQGNTEEAQKRFEELLPDMEQALGPDHPHTQETIRELDGIRKRHEKPEDKRRSPHKPAS